MLQDGLTESHNVWIYGRTRTEITAVQEIESFQENCIELLTNAGELVLDGENLKIDHFSVETGKAVVLGKVTGMYYAESNVDKNGFFFRRHKN